MVFLMLVSSMSTYACPAGTGAAAVAPGEGLCAIAGLGGAHSRLGVPGGLGAATGTGFRPFCWMCSRRSLKESELKDYT